jgi:hypothetical protein
LLYGAMVDCASFAINALKKKAFVSKTGRDFPRQIHEMFGRFIELCKKRTLPDAAPGENP